MNRLLRKLRGVTGFALTWGALWAVLFAAVVLSVAERGKPILDLSLGRAAAWGILGSAVFPLLTGRADQVFILGPLGAAIATAFVAIARRAVLRDSELSKRPLGVLFYGVLTFVRDAVDPPKELST